MTQYDAGPGDWSDREWEEPGRERKPHAKKRRVVLPPWALLVILVAVVIVLCVILVFIIRGLTGSDEEAPTVPVTPATVELAPTATIQVVEPTAAEQEPPTPTVTLPTEEIGETPPPAPPTEIGPGTTVVVTGTGGRGLNLRADPSVSGRLVAGVPDGTELEVLAGPQDGDGFTWWQVRAPDGKEGWAAADWLVLKTD
jgi:hypothetical protein